MSNIILDKRLGFGGCESILCSSSDHPSFSGNIHVILQRYSINLLVAKYSRYASSIRLVCCLVVWWMVDILCHYLLIINFIFRILSGVRQTAGFSSILSQYLYRSKKVTRHNVANSISLLTRLEIKFTPIKIIDDVMRLHCVFLVSIRSLLTSVRCLQDN